MKRNSVLVILVIMAFSAVAQTQSNKTDYATALKLKSLDNREAKLHARLDSLKNVTIMAADPIVLERKKMVRDSMLLSVKSEIVAVELERKEIQAKQKKQVSK